MSAKPSLASPNPRLSYQFGAFELDTSRRELRRSGERVALEPKVYDTLAYLAAHSDRVVPKDELFEVLWPDEVLSEGVLTRCIWAVRKAIGDGGRQQQLIRTIQRRGYRFVAPLRVMQPEPQIEAAAHPARVAGEHERAFVGRHAELSKLDAMLEAAMSGEPQFAWLSGPAGMGKSRLLEEFCRLASRYPEKPAPSSDDTSQARFRLFSGLQNFVRTLSADRPLVLILEDVHWADPSSLLLLRSLIPRDHSGRWLIVAAFRSYELTASDSRAEICSGIAEDIRVEHLELEPMTEAAVARLAESVAGRVIDGSWVSELHARSDGVPLAAIELVRYLDERGELDKLPKRGRLLPRDMLATLDHRLDALSTPCSDVLGRAAVFGREFRFDALAEISRDVTQDLLELLEEASNAHLISEVRDHVGSFRFRHALLRDAAYARLPMSQRVRLHREVGALLERAYQNSSEVPYTTLAHHFAQSPIRDDRLKAAQLSELAAAEALRTLAYPEAEEHYLGALAIVEELTPGDEVRRVKLLHGSGLAQRGSGNHQAAEETFRQVVQRARVLVERELFARGAVQLEESRYTARTSPEASLPLLEEALEGLPKAPSLLRVQVLDRLAAAFNVLNDPRRLSRSREAVDLARRLGDLVALTQALINRHVAIWGPDSLEERLALGDELREISTRVERAPDSFGVGAEVWSNERRLSDLLEMGDLEGLEAALDGACVRLETALPHAVRRRRSCASRRIPGLRCTCSTFTCSRTPYVSCRDTSVLPRRALSRWRRSARSYKLEMFWRVCRFSSSGFATCRGG